MRVRVLLRPTRARTDPERGAVAVLVAVLASAVLFTVGALAVDLGSAWAERYGLQAVAESAALAGAAELPMTPLLLSDPAVDAAEGDAVEAAARTLCADGNRRDAWDALCTAGTWATDGNPDNGEIDVVDSEQAYPTAFTASRLESVPRVLRVRTPPVRVEFGLARTVGADDIDVAATASARRGLPYPADRRLAVAPFYLTLDDLEDPDYEGICLRTTDRPTTTSWPPVPDPTPTSISDATPLLQIGTVDDTDPDAPSASDSITGTQSPVTRVLRGTVMTGVPGTVLPASVTVYVGDDDPAHTATTQSITFLPSTDPGPGDDRFDITFRTPDLTNDPAYGGPVPIWIVYTDPSGGQFVSTTAGLTYPDPPGRPSADCDTADAGRGLVDLDRADPAETPRRRWDVALGLPTEVHVFGSWPVAQDTPATDEDCYDATVGGEVRPDVPPADGEWVPEVNCVALSEGLSVREVDLTDGWLGVAGSDNVPPGGRLRTLCTADTGSISGFSGTFDATSLFRSSNGLMASGVSSFALRDRIRNGLAANSSYRGALVEKVFDCPRLLLVPVLDTSNPPAGTNGGAGTYPVVGLTYFYVYDRIDVTRARRGLIMQSGRIVGVRGWVVDPAYVRGGDWIDHLEDPDDALPYAVPKRAVLVRAPGDNHPDTGT